MPRKTQTNYNKKKKEAYELYTLNCNALHNTGNNKRKISTTSPDRIPETSKLQTDAIQDTKQKITKIDSAPVHTQSGRQEQKLHTLKRKHSFEHAREPESDSPSESDSDEFTEEQEEQLDQIVAEFEREQLERLFKDLVLPSDYHYYN